MCQRCQLSCKGPVGKWVFTLSWRYTTQTLRTADIRTQATSSLCDWQWSEACGGGAVQLSNRHSALIADHTMDGAEGQMHTEGLYRHEPDLGQCSGLEQQQRKPNPNASLPLERECSTVYALSIQSGYRSPAVLHSMTAHYRITAPRFPSNVHLISSGNPRGVGY